MKRRSALGALFATAANLPLRAQTELSVGGAALEVSLDGEGFDLPRTALLDWVKQAARAVSAYYGGFPVPRARVRIFAKDGHGVSGGRSFGFDGAHCRISVGRRTTGEELARDWELTHEMVHFGFPNVAEAHHWIEEGTATYVEPIARAQAGTLTEAEVWGDVLRDMPQGLPGTGDRGLDHTHTWGRTYWGGALFCLLADVGIRRNTGNTKGLQDALRAIVRAGGTIENDWPLERAFETGDRATDGKTLTALYGQMRSEPVATDLPGLWKELGVARQGGTAVFDNRAPLASIRAGILRAAPGLHGRA